MNIPNFLTFFRIALVPVFFTVLLTPVSEFQNARTWALAIFCMAIITDALDGFLARRLNQKSELGTFLDPVADKFLVLTGVAALSLTSQNVFKLPLWIQVAIYFRDMFLIGGVVTFSVLAKKHVFESDFFGKVTTVAQMILIPVCILDLPQALLFAQLTAALTIGSIFTYTIRRLPLLPEARV